MLFIMGTGVKEQDRLLLLDTGEVEQVGVYDRVLVSIGIGRADVVGVDDRQRICREQSRQAAAIANEQLC